MLLEHRDDRAGQRRRTAARTNVAAGSAAFNLGVLLRAGRLDGAEAAYRRADERGEAEGAFYLGEHARRTGRHGERRARLRRRTPRPAAAAFKVGGLLVAQGDLVGAEAAYRRADERGHVAGAFNLGVLLEERGDLAGAEAAYRRAEKRGHGEVAEMARAALLELGGRR